jgi:hypothetical protein
MRTSILLFFFCLTSYPGFAFEEAEFECSTGNCPNKTKTVGPVCEGEIWCYCNSTVFNGPKFYKKGLLPCGSLCTEVDIDPGKACDEAQGYAMLLVKSCGQGCTGSEKNVTDENDSGSCCSVTVERECNKTINSEDESEYCEDEF